VTTATVAGGATPEMSDGFEGVDGTDGVEGVFETGGAEVDPLPPPQPAKDAVNKSKGKARARRRVTIAEPPRTNVVNAGTTFNVVEQRKSAADFFRP
jgi:hypothetical protein